MRRSTQSNSRKQFIGTWRLVSYKIRDSRNSFHYPLGKNAIGLLMYDAAGNMSGQLMNAKRNRYAGDNLGTGTQKEMSLAMKSYLAYFGTYRVNEREKSITHIVRGSLFPNWTGSRQKRYYRITGNSLVLSAGFILDDEEHTAILTWKRRA